jgi:hypothetical protein
MHNDYEYWRNPPGAPSEDDKEMFEGLLRGDNILLLGSTKILLDLATDAYDLCPKWDNPKIQDRDWLSIDKHYDTIIGCGPFNFTEELKEKLFPVLKEHCSRLVIRVIRKPNWKTKYAQYFPEPMDFEIQPVVYGDDGTHRFYVWDFE